MLEILIPIGLGWIVGLIMVAIGFILVWIHKISPTTIHVLFNLAAVACIIFILYILGLIVQFLMGSPFPC